MNKRINGINDLPMGVSWVIEMNHVPYLFKVSPSGYFVRTAYSVDEGDRIHLGSEIFICAVFMSEEWFIPCGFFIKLLTIIASHQFIACTDESDWEKKAVAAYRAYEKRYEDVLNFTREWTDWEIEVPF